jgi:LysR family transcriptional regulator, glycine cleavage system transcriptional activator
MGMSPGPKIPRGKAASSPAPGRALRRLPLASLRVFVCAAQESSFSRAASTLGVTLAAVSMQVRALEQYLGVPLFVRRGRRVELTGEGMRLLPKLKSALTELERAVDEARLERRSGGLTVSSLSSFLQQWLLPRLPDFQQRHPEVDLRFHTSVALVDFLNSDVQIAIRFGVGRWPGLHAQKILDDWLVPVGLKRLVERNGPVATQEDLARYPLLHSQTETWDEWVDGTARVAWNGSGPGFDDSTIVVRAALAGQGLALSRWSLVANEVADGSLVIASRKIVKTAGAYYFVCPESYLVLDKVRLFRDWLLEQGRHSPAPPKPSN